MKTMSQISIASSKHIDFIRNRLDDEFKLLQAEGVQINLQEKARGNYTFLGYHLQGQNETSSHDNLLLKHYVAKAISDVVVAKWEENLVQGIVKNHYYYFNEGERKEIVQRTLELLKEYDEIPRKNKILLKVMDYLESNDDLILDGFITFRLQEYINELEEAVDQVVDDFLMEREYNEFIRLLRYFVDIQEPRINLVNVLLKPTGYFQLYDGNENVITNEYLEGFIIDLPEGEINYEDLLLSALITIAPSKIILHLPDETKVQNTINTIKNVFGERVTLCPGCLKCTTFKHKN